MRIQTLFLTLLARNESPQNLLQNPSFTMGVCWDRLIRFVATDGRTLRGEPILPSPDFDLGTVTEQTGLKARIIEGSDIYDDSGKTRVTEQIVQVKELLGPLSQDDVDILRCVGLNYAKHSMILTNWERRSC